MKMLNTFGLQLQEQQHGLSNPALMQQIHQENQQFHAQSPQQLQQYQLNQLVTNEFQNNPVQFEGTDDNRINSLKSSVADLATQQQFQQINAIAGDGNYEQIVNHCSQLNGAMIAYCSSALINCQPQNLLLPQRNRIWMSQEGMPQSVVIDLRSLKDPPKSFKCIGFDCWHDYSSNPQTLELAVSIDGSHFITWITFKAPLRGGQQFFAIDPFSPSKYPFVQFIIKETHGASKVYMNSLYLLEEVPIVLQYPVLTQSANLQKVTSAAGTAAQPLAASSSQMYSHQSLSQQQQTQSMTQSDVIQLEQQKQQGHYVNGISKQPQHNTYNNNNNNLSVNQVISPFNYSQASYPHQHTDQSSNNNNNNNNPHNNQNNYWNNTFTAVDNKGSKKSQQYVDNIGIMYSFNQQSAIQQQAQLKDQYIYQKPLEQHRHQNQYGTTNDTWMARTNNNYSQETMTDTDKLFSQRESISQQAQNHRQLRFEKESKRYDSNEIEEMQQPIRIHQIRKEQQQQLLSQESQSYENNYHNMDNQKQQRISQGLINDHNQHDNHLNQGKYYQNMHNSNQKAHTNIAEINGWNQNNNPNNIRQSNTNLNSNSRSSLISFKRNSQQQQQQFLENSSHMKQKQEESQMRNIQKNYGSQSKNYLDPYDDHQQYEYRMNTNSESYEDPRNYQSPGKTNNYAGNSRYPKSGYYSISSQSNRPHQELEYQQDNYDDEHKSVLFLGSPKRKWSSKIPQSREDARSFVVDASIQSQSVSHLHNSTPKQYSQQSQRIQYSNKKYNQEDDINQDIEGQQYDKNASFNHAPQLRSQQKQSNETQQFGQELLQTQLQVAKLTELIRKTQETNFLAVDKLSMLSKSLQDMESNVKGQLQVIAEQQSEIKKSQQDKDKGIKKQDEGRSNQLKQSVIQKKDNDSRVDQEITEKKDNNNTGKNKGDEGDIKDSRMRSSELNFKQSLLMEQIVEKAVEEKMETLEHSLCHLLLNSISRVQHSNNKHIQEDEEEEDDYVNEHFLKRSKQHKRPLVIQDIQQTPQKSQDFNSDNQKHQQQKSTSRQFKIKQQEPFSSKEEVDSQAEHKGLDEGLDNKGMKRVMRLLQQLQDKLDKRANVIDIQRKTGLAKHS